MIISRYDPKHPDQNILLCHKPVTQVELALSREIPRALEAAEPNQQVVVYREPTKWAISLQPYPHYPNEETKFQQMIRMVAGKTANHFSIAGNLAWFINATIIDISWVDLGFASVEDFNFWVHCWIPLREAKV